MDNTESWQELDASIQVALNQMLQAEPSSEDQQDVIARIMLTPPVAEENKRVVRLRVPHGVWSLVRLEFAAACLIGIALSFVASTEAWGQVTRNLADPLNEPQPITTAAAESIPQPVSEASTSFGRRLVLLAHVAFLSLGLCGMTASWCLSFGKYFLPRLRSSQHTGAKLLFENRLLATGMILYAGGTALGVVWSRMTWGHYWQWSPQELFCLLSLCVGVLWIGIARPISLSENRFANGAAFAQKMSLITIAYGTISAMVPIASQFTSLQSKHTYGSASGFSFVMTIIFLFFAVCISTIWVSHFAGRRPVGERE